MEEDAKLALKRQLDIQLAFDRQMLVEARAQLRDAEQWIARTTILINATKRKAYRAGITLT